LYDQTGPVSSALRQGKNRIPDDNGATNVEEFRAMSVESFIERFVEFRDKMPGFYDALFDLLKRNSPFPGQYY